MNIFEFVLIIAAILVGVVLIVLLVTKKGRIYLRAFVDSFFTEANKNPKIVSEYYDDKIEQLQKNYEKADNAYRKAAGESMANEKQIKELSKELEKINKSIVNARKNGNMDDARMYANEAISLKAELDAKQENVPVFKEAMQSAGDLREKAKMAIENLKGRKKADIAKAEAGKAAQEIYSQFDESRVSSDIDRILEQFGEYADEQEKMGMGAKASWDSSYDAQKLKAEKRARANEADDYIQSLVDCVKPDNQ
ncbi:MAG: PspA/IM30 family protein [Clostridia bacterium]